MLSTLANVGITSDNAVQFTLNKFQAQALTVMPNEMWIVAGRGTGKTIGIEAPWILHKVFAMPRSNGGFIGQTFAQIEEKLLQPLQMAFQQLGYKKHTTKEPGQYVYGKKPPEEWPEPLTPIIDYSHVMTFYNGTTLEFISLHLQGSANAKSLQWLVADEAKYLNQERLQTEVFPILRGHIDTFGDSAWYGAKLFLTDKLHPNIKWILNKKKLCNPKDVNTVIWYQMEVNRLYEELDHYSQNEYYKRVRKIAEYEEILTVMRKDMVYYGESSALENIENLGVEFFKTQMRSNTPYQFRVQILNFDPTRSEKNFYHGRSEKNLYYQEADNDITQPLGVTLDYQASISPLVSFQVNDLVNGRMQLNFCKSLHVLQPLGLKHVIDDFCNYHHHRINKTVYYFYDHTATGERNMHKKYYEEVTDYFEDNGWNVVQIYTGLAPAHGTKYNLINNWLTEDKLDDDQLPIGFNASENTHLILSMDQADTKESDKGTLKDKSKEKDKSFPQEEAPHYSDCFDQAVFAVNYMHLYPAASEETSGIAFRLG